MSVGTLLLIVVILTVDLFSLGTLVKRIIQKKKQLKIFKHLKHIIKRERYRQELNNWIYCYQLSQIKYYERDLTLEEFYDKVM